MAETAPGKSRGGRKDERPWAAAVAASRSTGGFLVLGGALAAAAVGGLAAIKRRGGASPVLGDSSAIDPAASTSDPLADAPTSVTAVGSTQDSVKVDTGRRGNELEGKGLQALLLKLQNHQPSKNPSSASSAPPASPTDGEQMPQAASLPEGPSSLASQTADDQPIDEAFIGTSQLPGPQIYEDMQKRAEDQGQRGISGTDDDEDDREDASDVATGGSWTDSAGEPIWPAEASSEDEDSSSEDETERGMKSVFDIDPIKGRGSVAATLLKDAARQFIAKKAPAGFTPPALESGKDDLRHGSPLVAAIASAVVSAKEGAGVFLRSGPAALMFVFVAVLILKIGRGSDQELLLLKTYRHIRHALFPDTNSTMSCTAA